MKRRDFLKLFAAAPAVTIVGSPDTNAEVTKTIAKQPTEGDLLDLIQRRRTLVVDTFCVPDITARNALCMDYKYGAVVEVLDASSDLQSLTWNKDGGAIYKWTGEWHLIAIIQ